MAKFDDIRTNTASRLKRRAAFYRHGWALILPSKPTSALKKCLEHPHDRRTRHIPCSHERL